MRDEPDDSQTSNWAALLTYVPEQVDSLRFWARVAQLAFFAVWSLALMRLNDHTGEAGGHDWIYLLSSTGLLYRAHMLGGLTHALGALVVLVSLGWAAWLLRQQYPQRAGQVRDEG